MGGTLSLSLCVCRGNITLRRNLHDYLCLLCERARAQCSRLTEHPGISTQTRTHSKQRRGRWARAGGAHTDRRVEDAARLHSRKLERKYSVYVWCLVWCGVCMFANGKFERKITGRACTKCVLPKCAHPGTTIYRSGVYCAHRFGHLLWTERVRFVCVFLCDVMNTIYTLFPFSWLPANEHEHTKKRCCWFCV